MEVLAFHQARRMRALIVNIVGSSVLLVMPIVVLLGVTGGNFVVQYALAGLGTALHDVSHIVHDKYLVAGLNFNFAIKVRAFVLGAMFACHDLYLFLFWFSGVTLIFCPTIEQRHD